MTGLECGFVRQHFHDLISDEIDDEHRERIYEHLNSCDSCRTHVENALAFRSRMQELMQTSAPPGLVASIMQLSEKG
jgi:predicted anti-sigma-YlaC factor YlaD